MNVFILLGWQYMYVVIWMTSRRRIGSRSSRGRGGKGRRVKGMTKRTFKPYFSWEKNEIPASLNDLGLRNGVTFAEGDSYL